MWSGDQLLAYNSPGDSVLGLNLAKKDRMLDCFSSVLPIVLGLDARDVGVLEVGLEGEGVVVS